MRFIYKIGLVLIALLYNHLSYSQTTNVLFGKAKVQYKPLVWSYYESENFNTYFSTGGYELGKFVVTAAEKDLNEIKDALEFSFTKKIEIIVFGDISDYNQSNIGYEPSSNAYNTGGSNTLINNKIFVYFNGDHQQLNVQIKKGIAKVMLDYMLFGSSLQEILQNAVMLNLPPWYTDGLLSYIAEGWNSNTDAYLKDLIVNNKIKNFNAFANTNPELAGQSFWNYIYEKFDKTTISNLVYITRINRSMEAGFMFVLGKHIDEAQADWLQYYTDRYANDDNGRKQASAKNKWEVSIKKHKTNSAAKLNVSGDYIAYFTKQNNQFALYVQSEGEKPTLVFKQGLKNSYLPNDALNPVFCWDYTGKKLLAYFQKRKKYYFLTYDVASKKREIKERNSYYKVLDINPGPEKNTLLITAIKEAASDIYLDYYTSGKTITITNDFWDDKDPCYVDCNNRKGILFASNRKGTQLSEKKLAMDTTLPIQAYHIYFYNLQTKKLTQVSNSNTAQESFPIAYNNTVIAYLSNDAGLNNRYIATVDSAFVKTDTVVYFVDSTITNPMYTPADSFVNIPNTIIDSIKYINIYKDTFNTYPLTNYKNNIAKQQAVYRSKYILDAYLNNGIIEYYKIPIRDEVSLEMSAAKPITWKAKQIDLMNKQLKSRITETQDNSTNTVQLDSVKLKSNIHNAVYQNEFIMPWDTAFYYYKDTSIALVKESIFKANRVVPYLLKTYTNSYYLQFDKNTIVPLYQQFLGTDNLYRVEPLSLWLRADIKDIMEDYRIQLGVAAGTSLGSSQYFIKFQDFRNRLDKEYTLYRKSETIYAKAGNLNIKLRSKINYAEAKAQYPLDEFRSLRGYVGLRNNVLTFLSTETNTLQEPTINEYWGNAKLEYVHDNTMLKQLNIYNGLRYKLFAEFQQNLKVKNGNTILLGLDIRHYQKIFRNIIWANRIAYQTSFGHDRFVYFLGGVDSWVLGGYKGAGLNKVNQNTKVDESYTYSYQALATNLRGFQHNIRNGSSFAVWNSEVRIPIASSLSSKKIKKDFVKNFQLIAFYDMGSAWSSFSPLSDKAKISFTETIHNANSPVSVSVNYFRNPIIYGYGWGMRTSIAGYFIRLDFAHGVDNFIKTKRITYVSLSTDF